MALLLALASTRRIRYCSTPGHLHRFYIYFSGCNHVSTSETPPKMQSSVPPEIPGHIMPHDATEQLRHSVANLLERDSTRFPGAQPVSFGREHIAELQRTEYFMCEKTDGIRVLLYLTYIDTGNSFDPATFFIDRKNNYYEVTPALRFPYYRFPGEPDKFLFNTILDGELVHDTVPGEPEPRLVFYVFDCLALDNANNTGRPLDIRIGKLKEHVFKPYMAWMAANPQLHLQQPFRVQEKQVYPPYSFAAMFNQVLPTLRHGNDGLIFTCKNTRYEFGTDKHILKWKPPHENTIDFKLKLGDFPTFDPEDGEEGLIPDYDAKPLRFILLVNHGSNNNQPFGHDLTVSDQEWEILKGLNQRLDGRIIECYRADHDTWRYKPEHDGSPRWRDDKKDANHISTVRSVLESIEDPVTEQDLLSVEGRIKQAVKRLREEEKEKRDRARQQAQQQQQHAGPHHDAKKRKYSEANGNGSTH
ncbi:mRNA capping enzyme, alpha subunit [Pleomassaria siparia CBS 279.74]|uniref:mRNA-capping enzyme subunit alpha n=1 Tax=Pleomassaria siparia CBS 279.74 TaxID=1314801 RepID=A0A6G1KRK8_9PLEO|nr:mRNA capping enzyme, alpha subunit [Pleomassaria siparia CBS 279.74]